MKNLMKKILGKDYSKNLVRNFCLYRLKMLRTDETENGKHSLNPTTLQRRYEYFFGACFSKRRQRSTARIT